MCYIITIFSLLCCTCLPPALSGAHDSVRTHRSAWAAGSITADRSQRSMFLAQAGRTAAPETKAPAPQKQDGASGEGRVQEKPPQQKDKKPAPKDFVPSETIDADKAVDFPADI